MACSKEQKSEHLKEMATAQSKEKAMEGRIQKEEGGMLWA